MSNQKLALYKEYLARHDKARFMSQFIGFSDAKERVDREMDRMQEYYNKITKVPKFYTIDKLKI